VASPHCRVKNFSRSKGQSAIACAAYRAGDKLRDERTDELKDYSRKHGVLHSEIVLPKDAPEWAKNREQLWNAVERSEDKSTTPHKARAAQELELALPCELTLEQNTWLVKDIIKQEYTRKGCAADFNIHAPHREGDQRNIHAHILYSERPLTAEGFSKAKDRSFQDYHYFEGLRDRCEEHIKHHLERHGFKEQAEKFSLKSLEEQGIDREPTHHVGPTAAEMERRGILSERGAANREVTGRNLEYAELKAEMGKIALDLAEAVKAEQKARRPDYMAKTTQDIRMAWTVSDGELAFMMALGEQGLHVAQDENGRYVAIDSTNGFKHWLSGKAYGETAKAMSAALDATRADGLIIPTIDEYFSDLKRQRAEKRAECNQAFEEQNQIRFYENSLELNQTQADIRLCFNLTASGQSFAEALEAKGHILARTATPDVQGGLAVVNQWGHVYALTERTTGHSRGDIAARCATVNHAELLTVQDAKAVMRDMQDARAYQNSLELNQTQADIRLAFGLTASGQSTVEALEAKGIILSKATAQDVDMARAVAGLLAHEKDTPAWKTRAGFKEGDLVAVNQWGHVYALTERTTGHSRDDIAARSATANHDELLSVQDAKAVMRDMQSARAKEYVLKNKQYGAHRGALLYDRADMAHMQLDALRHLRDAHRLNPLPFHPDDHRLLQEAQNSKRRENREEARDRKPERAKDAATLKREHKEATTEMTAGNRSRADKQAVQEQTAKRDDARSRDEEGGGRQLQREQE
jgi:hypothetical protein